MTAPTRTQAAPSVGQPPRVRLPPTVRDAYAEGWIECAQWMLIPPTGRRGAVPRIDPPPASPSPVEPSSVRRSPRRMLTSNRRQMLLTGLLGLWLVVAVVFAALAT